MHYKRSLEYLFDEVGVSKPHERALRAGDTDQWPEGWWGVYDENDGYIAYFANESDAYAFRLFLITFRQQGKAIASRYKLR